MIRYKILLTVTFCFLAVITHAQTPAQIEDELKAINSKITNAPCNTGTGMLISNKAMSVFLASKVGTYLSENSDLSLFKNSVMLNAAEGGIAIKHNLHQPTDGDDYIHSFIAIGARANITNTYATKFAYRQAANQLGFTLQKTWLGKLLTYFDKCGNQKLTLDAERAALVNRLELALNKKAAEFDLSVNKITQAQVPGQDVATAKQKLQKEFYANLRNEYLQQFAQEQSDILINSNNFNLVTSNWTSIGIYLPVLAQKFEVSPVAGQSGANHYNYPLELWASHTRFWESTKFGRVFLSFVGKAFYNSSAQSGNLFSPLLNTYVGDYKNYITPSLAAKLAYFPRTSHFGISFRAEKNFGSYHALNYMAGVPIVLIDKKGAPAVTFEPQILFGNSNTAIGFTAGIPFSKMVL